MSIVRVQITCEIVCVGRVFRNKNSLYILCHSVHNLIGKEGCVRVCMLLLERGVRVQ